MHAQYDAKLSKLKANEAEYERSFTTEDAGAYKGYLDFTREERNAKRQTPSLGKEAPEDSASTKAKRAETDAGIYHRML